MVENLLYSFLVKVFNLKDKKIRGSGILIVIVVLVVLYLKLNNLFLLMFDIVNEFGIDIDLIVIMVGVLRGYIEGI